MFIMAPSKQPTNPDISIVQYLSAVRSSVSHSKKASGVLISTTELREMIMELLDPLAFLNLISTCSAALATFLRFPRRHLHSSVEMLSLPRPRITMAILEARRLRPSYHTVLEDPHQYEDEYGGPKTELDAFVDFHLWSVLLGCDNGPEKLQDPLDALRIVATIHDPVETLT